MTKLLESSPTTSSFERRKPQAGCGINNFMDGRFLDPTIFALRSCLPVNVAEQIIYWQIAAAGTFSTHCSSPKIAVRHFHQDRGPTFSWRRL
jgi:hypothetical protein